MQVSEPKLDFEKKPTFVKFYGGCAGCCCAEIIVVAGALIGGVLIGGIAGAVRSPKKRLRGAFIGIFVGLCFGMIVSMAFLKAVN